MSIPQSKRTALVLGATGGIGGEVARVILHNGWRVRALHRDPDRAKGKAADLLNVDWIAGDAMNARDVIAAADGVELIVHGVNPPGYRNWQQLALPMLENSVVAAKASGARLVFPGTLYNYGPDAFPLIGETSPQNVLTRKGRIRVAMERHLRAASEEGVKVLIVRAGDYFGSHAGNSWFAQAMVKPGRPVTSIVYPGKPEAGHAWAYLPDLALTIVQLVERDEQLADFDVFHFGGHWFDRGIGMAEVVQRVVGSPVPPIRRFPWWMVRLGSPFVGLFREMLELVYLWHQPVRLDNSKLIAFLGSEPHTSIEDAVRTTLTGLGALREHQH